MFKRRRSPEDETAAHDEAVVDDELFEEPDDLADADADDVELDEADVDDDADDADGGLRSARGGGPFDVSEIDDDIERFDLGALRLHPVEGVEVRLEVDEASGAVQAVTFVHGETAMQVAAFAAPRTEGIWEEVRTEIAASIAGSGGTVDHVPGVFGTELRTRLQAQDDQGRAIEQSLRFVGVDGPRWFLRGLVTGPGVSDAEALAPLAESFQRIVVVRGDDPMAPHEPLPLRLPSEVLAEDPNPEASGHDLNPFRRGPEITEIR